MMIEKQKKQKPAEWSKEDAAMHTRCCGILGKCAIGELPLSVTEEFDWLKSLPERFNLRLID